jgi:hypothetical protein
LESPYFSKIYDFGQDVDKIYKDFVKNDILTNIRKYTKILYDFIREKYFTIVPFGKNAHCQYSARDNLLLKSSFIHSAVKFLI